MSKERHQQQPFLQGTIDIVTGDIIPLPPKPSLSIDPHTYPFVIEDAILPHPSSSKTHQERLHGLLRTTNQP